MSDGLFDALAASPFVRLRELLDAHAPRSGDEGVSLALGEPQHAPPRFALEALARATQDDAAADYGRYPPIDGTPAWRKAVTGWLSRRFGVAADAWSPTQILPLNGTREGLFLAAQMAPPKEALPKEGGLMAMPNPFYQVYAHAALAAGAAPLYLDAPRDNGFLPDFEALDEATLARLRAVYLCSPANPQGAVADMAYLRRVCDLARAHGFLLLVDECYSEIYDTTPPPSILQVMDENMDDDVPVMAFHSLSKRSNLAGLRSGFVAGSKTVMAGFHKLRMVAGPQSPFATQAAAALAWDDEAHVEDNRAAYRAKFDMAEEIFGDSFGFYRPEGGFFLWLNVGDGEKAAEILWREAGVKVLPGAYLAQSTAHGNIGAPYIRVALVAPLAETKAALMRVKACLDSHGVTVSMNEAAQ